jgi:hypothetical protein
MTLAAWRRLDVTDGLGIGVLLKGSAGFRVEGRETIVDGPTAWSIQFDIDLDDSWRTRAALLTVLTASGIQNRHLEADGNGHWLVDGEQQPDLDGCLDMDVVSTPFTNTFPIRRLGLAATERREIDVAWVDVPSLEVSRERQRYTRLAPLEGVDRWEFVALGSGERYLLTVDAEGLVLDYERFARRVL